MVLNLLYIIVIFISIVIGVVVITLLWDVFEYEIWLLCTDPRYLIKLLKARRKSKKLLKARRKLKKLLKARRKLKKLMGNDYFLHKSKK